MDPGTYARVNALLNQLLDLPEAERDRALESMAHSEDEVVVGEVRALLDEPMRATFLETSVLDGDGLAENDLSGARLGRLRIDELIARGGMGAVYRGYDELLGRAVAVKVLRQGLRLSRRQREQFLNEARSLSSVHHPNICSLFDFVEVDGLDLLVLEFVEGQTLRELLREGRPFDRLAVLLEITEALVAAHERGIAHRDLKPDNVMLTAEGAVKVLDFGLARGEVDPEPGQKLGAADTDVPVDPAGTAVARTLLAGTPGYMAPEQALAEASTTATDLYSLGVLMIELLEGRRPHPKGASSNELIERARTSQIDEPRHLPRAETALIRDLLQPDPGRRPTARAARERLQRIIDRPRRRLRFGLAAGLLVVAVGAGAKYTLDLRQSEAAAQRARAEAEQLAGFMLNELHTGLEEVGRLDLLDLVANRSLAYYDSLGEEGLRAGRGEAPLALMQIGTVLDLSGSHAEAVAVLERAATALADLNRRSPDDELVAYRTALTHLQLAETAKAGGAWDVALGALDVVDERTTRLVAGLQPGHGPQDAPTAPERWRLRLRSGYLRADVHLRVGDHERAATIVEDLTPIATAVVAEQPTLSTDLADLLYKACDIGLQLERTDSVLDDCQGALALDRELYQQDPDRSIYLRNYTDASLRMHDARRLVGDLEGALVEATRAEELARRAIERTPSNEHVRNDLARILSIKGDTMIRLGSVEAGRAAVEESLAISTPLVADPEEVTFQHTHAMTLLRSGRVEEARPFVENLIERGFVRREFLELSAQHGLIPAATAAQPEGSS